MFSPVHARSQVQTVASHTWPLRWALFGATSEVKNRPLGGRVRLVTRDGLACRPCQGTPRWAACQEDWRCMDIPVETVTGVLEEALA